MYFQSILFFNLMTVPQTYPIVSLLNELF